MKPTPLQDTPHEQDENENDTTNVDGNNEMPTKTNEAEMMCVTHLVQRMIENQEKLRQHRNNQTQF